MVTSRLTPESLDPLINLPARLGIVVTLAALRDGDELSFRRLQDIIASTPGNLVTHLRKLEEAGYLSSREATNGSGSQTSVSLTASGRAALDGYQVALSGLLQGSRSMGTVVTR